MLAALLVTALCNTSTNCVRGGHERLNRRSDPQVFVCAVAAVCRHLFRRRRRKKKRCANVGRARAMKESAEAGDRDHQRQLRVVCVCVDLDPRPAACTSNSSADERDACAAGCFFGGGGEPRDIINTELGCARVESAGLQVMCATEGAVTPLQKAGAQGSATTQKKQESEGEVGFSAQMPRL